MVHPPQGTAEQEGYLDPGHGEVRDFELDPDGGLLLGGGLFGGYARQRGFSSQHVLLGKLRRIIGVGSQLWDGHQRIIVRNRRPVPCRRERTLSSRPGRRSPGRRRPSPWRSVHWDWSHPEGEAAGFPRSSQCCVRSDENGNDSGRLFMASSAKRKKKEAARGHSDYLRSLNWLRALTVSSIRLLECLSTWASTQIKGFTWRTGASHEREDTDGCWRLELGEKC